MIYKTLAKCYQLTNFWFWNMVLYIPSISMFVETERFQICVWTIPCLLKASNCLDLLIMWCLEWEGREVSQRITPNENHITILYFFYLYPQGNNVFKLIPRELSNIMLSKFATKSKKRKTQFYFIDIMTFLNWNFDEMFVI